VTRHKIIGFPNPVNEKAAHTVAGGVLLLSCLTLVLSLAAGDPWLWLTVPISLGSIARVLTGPKLSPLGQLATKIVAPLLGAPKLVAGPPKRFAQGVGTAVTTAAVATLSLGYPGATQVLLGLMIVAAGLESIFAFCIGCKIFGGLMRLGVIPAATCGGLQQLLPHSACDAAVLASPVGGPDGNLIQQVNRAAHSPCLGHRVDWPGGTRGELRSPPRRRQLDMRPAPAAVLVGRSWCGKTVIVIGAVIVDTERMRPLRWAVRSVGLSIGVHPPIGSFIQL